MTSGESDSDRVIELENDMDDAVIEGDWMKYKWAMFEYGELIERIENETSD